MWTIFIPALCALLFAAVVFAMRKSRNQVRGLERRLQELQKEEDRVFDFLHGIGAAFSEGVRSSELHRLIVESSLRILDAQAGALYLTNKTDTALTPAFITSGCPPLVEIPQHILTQAGSNPAVIESFLQLQPVGKDAAGLFPDCWKNGATRLIAAGSDPQLPAHSAILGPLVYRHRTIGVMALVNPLSAPAFESKDLKVFRALAEQSAFALYNEAIYLEAGEKKLLDRDLEIARDIQRILLPESDPVFPGYELSAVSLAARHVSGDYFDYIPLGADRLGVAIADVSGKGVPASLIMAMCRGVLRREATASATASDVLRRVNSQLYPDIKEDMFISMAYLILDGAAGRVTLARAGHDAPLLYRAATGTVEKLSPKGMALGIDSGEVFNRVCADLSLVMEAGDCILLYTDGATEAMNQEGLEYGIERLIEALRTSAPHGAAGVVRHVAEDVKSLTGADFKHDDFTLIAISKK
jgi:sigma-B regulation protein RsbU (phosphoserine phosphatase)